MENLGQDEGIIMMAEVDPSFGRQEMPREKPYLKGWVFGDPRPVWRRFGGGSAVELQSSNSPGVDVM